MQFFFLFQVITLEILSHYELLSLYFVIQDNYFIIEILIMTYKIQLSLSHWREWASILYFMI